MNLSKELSIVSDLNSGTILSHFTSSENKKSLSGGPKNKDSNYTNHSSYLSLNTNKGTLKGYSNKTTKKTEEEKENNEIISYNRYYDIFIDENPVKNLLEILMNSHKSPHPSK